MALLAFLEGQDTALEASETACTLTDNQLLKQVSEHTQQVDPLAWPCNYELNEDLVLQAKDTGRIWVPPDEQLQQEVLATHHDGKIAGHLGTAGTLELVSRKYWWANLVDFTQ